MIVYCIQLLKSKEEEMEELQQKLSESWIDAGNQNFLVLKLT